jgi:hypothetical protein
MNRAVTRFAGRVSHLRRSGFYLRRFPARPRWAKFFRAYGAGPSPALQVCRWQVRRTNRAALRTGTAGSQDESRCPSSLPLAGSQDESRCSAIRGSDSRPGFTARDSATRKKRRREPTWFAPSFVQQARLLLARAVAGSATVGGSAAGYARRLDRCCKAERDYCQQHDCPNLLHGFSPLKIQIWFCGPMAMPSAGEQGKFVAVISRCEAGGWRGVCLCRCAKRAR